MKLIPTLEEIQSIRQSGQYDLVPVRTEILADFLTPIQALKKLKTISAHVFMLESAIPDQEWGRYTFLGFDPKLEITCKNGQFACGSLELESEDPSERVRSILSHYRAPALEGFPPFCGGLAGYFSFDYFGYAEPTSRVLEPDFTSMNDLDLMLFDKVIVFDHFRQKILLIANVELSHVEESYEKARLELEQMKAVLLSGKEKREKAGRLLEELQPRLSKPEYCSMVEKAKEHIHAGDIFQIVLANSLVAPFEGSLLNTYRQLRTLNPSPYMFYFSGEDMETAGASPETLVRLEKGKLTTFPLAGTRPRGKSPEEDRDLEAELLQDEKELAEHNMLVDLGRNDLGRVSRLGSVHVDSLHDILRYSHVMHIGSTVSGTLREDADALDAVEAVLPAGTLSGAPKIRAVQLIGELEGRHRGLYGGALGYISFSGDMDICIAIRLAVLRQGQVQVSSGAGIVADSVPEKEYQECLNKAQAVVSALKAAEEMES